MSNTDATLSLRPEASKKRGAIRYGEFEQGWCAPRSFTEFHSRYSNHIKIFLHSNNCPEDLREDFEQELIVRLMTPTSPRKSQFHKPSVKRDAAGEPLPAEQQPRPRYRYLDDGVYSDRIASYNPVVMHLNQDGSDAYAGPLLENDTEKLFLNYVSEILLARRYNALIQARKLDPTNPWGNTSYDENGTDEFDTDDDVLAQVAYNSVEEDSTKIFMNKFEEYVRTRHPELLDTLQAISDTESTQEAADLLGLDLKTVTQTKLKLQRLIQGFMGLSKDQARTRKAEMKAENEKMKRLQARLDRRSKELKTLRSAWREEDKAKKVVGSSTPWVVVSVAP